MFYFFIFLITFFLTIFFTWGVGVFAKKFNIVDKPGLERKIHKKVIPLLGGFAIFAVFFIVLFFVRDKLVAGSLEYRHWLGLFMGGAFIMTGGFFDDKYGLNPKKQIVWPVLAIASVIIGGVGIDKITNPLGGFIYLDVWQISFFSLGSFVVISDLFTIFWLMGMMYTTKLLDGVDGLVTGVVAIGATIIFIFTISTKYYQPDIALASLVLATSCLGFLVFNWHPAKIFLGEGGSLLLGFLLGVLAIISGGKIAIALLVMGIPIMDVAWIIIRRLKNRQNPFLIADRLHLHHRLLSLGIGQRKTVLIYYLLALIFGFFAIFLQTIGKIFALSFLVVIMLIVIVVFNYFERTKKT